MKPHAYKQWEHYVFGLPEKCVTAYLLHNEPPTYFTQQG